MKHLAPLIALFVFVATARAASPYAGEYLLTWKSYRPSAPSGKLEAGADVTITEDGALSGRGASFEQTLIRLTGQVGRAGNVIITETDTGVIATYEIVFHYTAHFDGRHQFSVDFPDGRVISGVKLDPARPEAGFYHAQIGDRAGWPWIGSGDEAFIFVERGGAVRAIVYDDDNVRTELNGEAMREAFRASSPEGETLAGEFAGEKITGRYSDGGGADHFFDGLRY